MKKTKYLREKVYNTMHFVCSYNDYAGSFESFYMSAGTTGGNGGAILHEVDSLI